MIRVVTGWSPSLTSFPSPQTSPTSLRTVSTRRTASRLRPMSSAWRYPRSRVEGYWYAPCSRQMTRLMRLGLPMRWAMQRRRQTRRTTPWMPCRTLTSWRRSLLTVMTPETSSGPYRSTKSGLRSRSRFARAKMACLYSKESHLKKCLLNFQGAESPIRL